MEQLRQAGATAQSLFDEVADGALELGEGIGGVLGADVGPPTIEELGKEVKTVRKCLTCAPDQGYNEKIPCLSRRMRESQRGQHAQAAYTFYGIYYRRFVAAFMVMFVVLVANPYRFGAEPKMDPYVPVESAELEAWKLDRTNVSLSSLGACSAVSEQSVRQFWRFATCAPEQFPECPTDVAKVAPSCSSRLAQISAAEHARLNGTCQTEYIMATLRETFSLAQEQAAEIAQLQSSWIRTTSGLQAQGCLAGCERSSCAAGHAIQAQNGERCDAPCKDLCGEMNRLFETLADKLSAAGLSCTTSVARLPGSTGHVVQLRPTDGLLTSGGRADMCLHCCEAGSCTQEQDCGTVCDDLAHFSADLVIAFSECPTHLTPELRAAVIVLAKNASGPVAQSLLDLLGNAMERATTLLALPPDLKAAFESCSAAVNATFSANRSHDRPPVATCMGYAEKYSKVMKDSTAIVAQIGHWSRAVENHHYVPAVMIIFTLVVLVFSAGSNYTRAHQAMTMTPRQEREYEQAYRTASECFEPEAWTVDESGDRVLLPGYRKREKRMRFILFDCKRANRDFIVAEAGNIARVAELEEMTSHKEFHFLNRSGQDNILSHGHGGEDGTTGHSHGHGDEKGGDGHRHGLSDENPLQAAGEECSGEHDGMIEEVLTHGSTPINYLVWRRSLLKVCQCILVANAIYAAKDAIQLAYPNVLYTAAHPDDGAPAGAPAGGTDVYSLAAEFLDDGCQILCTTQSTGSTVNCQDMCTVMTKTVNTTLLQVECDDPAVSSPSDDRLGAMKKKFFYYQMAQPVFKLVTTLLAIKQYHKATHHWLHLDKSFKDVTRGWMLVFTAPLVLSLCPWYTVLGFDDDSFSLSPFDSILAPPFGFWVAAKFRIQIGLNTYLATFSLGVALIPSMLRAIVQCKVLLPQSGIWTVFMYVLPLFAVILQWPFFSLISTWFPVVTNTIWLCLLVIAANPLVYALFGKAINSATTAAQAHKMFVYVKRFKLYFKMCALCIVVYGLAIAFSDAQTKGCRSMDSMDSIDDWDAYKQTYCKKSITGRMGLIGTLIKSWLQCDTFQTCGLSIMQTIMGPVPGFICSFVLSYYVTFAAMTDLMIRLIAFLWHHDNYMCHDTRMFEMSFLLADSLYEIRRRSPDLMHSFSSFLNAPDRANWIDSLEAKMIAFHKMDMSGDGQVDKRELANMLARLTADGGDLSVQCICRKCAPWSETPIDVSSAASGEGNLKHLDKIARAESIRRSVRVDPGAAVGDEWATHNHMPPLPSPRSRSRHGAIAITEDLAAAIAVATDSNHIGGTGVQVVCPNWSSFNEIFDSVDTDASGSIDFPEFVALSMAEDGVIKPLSEDQKADCLQIFGMFHASHTTLHEPKLFDRCSCYGCQIRILRGKSYGKHTGPTWDHTAQSPSKQQIEAEI